MRGKKFTLIELLVVITVIAILASLLLPALNRARDRAKTILCGSNVKQINGAISLYAGDNHGFLVPVNTVSTIVANSRWWTNLLSEYLPVKKWKNQASGSTDLDYSSVWTCPALVPMTFSWGGGYGIPENFLCQYPPSGPKLMARVPFPSRKVILLDTEKDSKSWISFGWPADWYTARGGAARNRHDRDACCGFVDGHVEKRNVTDLRSNKDNAFY